MSYMFWFCTSLYKLNLKKFDINNVKDVSYMFYKCKLLSDLNNNNFKVRKIAKKKSMISGCDDELINKIKDYVFKIIINLINIY